MSETYLSRARGRTPYKLTDEVVERICKRIAAGQFIEHACAAEYVTSKALRELRQRDEAVEVAVQAARAEWIAELRSMRESSNDWRRESWDLERFDREAFAPPKQSVENKNENSGPAGGPMQFVALTPAEARAEAERRIAALPAEQQAAARRLMEGE